jgi:hypothetical protein
LAFLVVTLSSDSAASSDESSSTAAMEAVVDWDNQRIKQRTDRKMTKKQVHTMATEEEVAPGSDWHFSVRTADGEVWLQGNSRVHTV